MALLHSRPMLLHMLGGLLVAVLAVVLSAYLFHAPFTYESAHARWEQQALEHYALEVEARDDQIDLHLLLEVRDERLVSGVNLRTGKRLTADDLAPQLTWLPVERLFDRIELERYISTTWRHQVADLAPWVAQQLSWCYVRPMHVAYDPQLGYPATLRFRHNVCSTHNALDVRFVVTPLP